MYPFPFQSLGRFRFYHVGLFGEQNACQLEGLPHIQTHFDSSSIVARNTNGLNQLQSNPFRMSHTLEATSVLPVAPEGHKATEKGFCCIVP